MPDAKHIVNKVIGLVPEVANYWKRAYTAAINGHCDIKQAAIIADDRTLTALMSRDAEIWAKAENAKNNQGRESPAEKLARVTGAVTSAA